MKSCSCRNAEKAADFLPCCPIAEPDIQSADPFHGKKRKADFLKYYIILFLHYLKPGLAVLSCGGFSGNEWRGNRL